MTITPLHGISRVLRSPLTVLLAVGLVWRLALAYLIIPGVGLQADLDLFRDWALTLADKGPGAFYASSSFADYTPGYLWFLWPLGLIAKAIGIACNVDPRLVAGSMVKLPAIAGDIAAALLVYRALDGWRGRRAALMGAAVFLFNPVTWYESAIWGQVDVIGALVLFAALLLLIRGRAEPATALAVLATLIKPQLGIGLVVVGAVLLHRHVLARGNGTNPRPTSDATDGRTAGLHGLTAMTGPLRLLTSALTGAVAAFAVILPFDLPALAPPNLAGVPLVGHLAGLISVVANAAEHYNVLTANAFNGWALAGPNPLTEALGSSPLTWTYDSLPVLGPISAAAFGSAAFAVVVAATIVYLLRSDGRWPILIGATVLAVAFFALPTRVHERYLYPVFLIAAPLAAAWIRWRVWYLVLAAANLANLHAILTLSFPGYGTAAAAALPFGDVLRTAPAITAVALTITVGFAWLIWQLGPVFSGQPAIEERDRDADEPTGSPHPGMVRLRRLLADLPARIVVAGRAYLGPLAARLAAPPSRPDRSAELDSEQGGRLDRRDAVYVVALFAAVLLSRTVGLARPVTMYFDELYHPRSGMEFLQDWRYGLPHAIYENSHPHVAKYLEALGIDAWGDNRVVATASIAVPVRAAAVDPTGIVPTRGNATPGRLVVATGDAVTVAALHDPTISPSLAIPGAQAVATDGGQIVVGTAQGEIFMLRAAVFVGAQPMPPPLVKLAGPVTGLWLGPGSVVARMGDSALVAIDPQTGAATGFAAIAGMGGAALHSVAGQPVISVTDATGLTVFDVRTLTRVFSAAIPGGATDAAFLDGSDALYRGRDMFGQPAIYVATGRSDLLTYTIDPGGQIRPTGQVPLPGPVTQLHWNAATNLVHMLGRTADGRPTVYVLEPNSNATFADAPLDFEPVGWGLDVVPDSPESDPERAVLVAADGRTATIDVGSNAFAWRLPGVIAGAVMAAALYLLVRLLFRRRSIALLSGGAVLVESLLYAQSRIGMNDTYVGAFIVLAFLVLAALVRVRGRGTATAISAALGLPIVGVLLGLALASKWVGAYAMGGAIVIVLMGSALGRVAIVAGLVVITGVLGFLALADSPSDITFALLMLVLTACAAVAAAQSARALTRRDMDYLSGAPLALALILAVVLAAALVVAGPAAVASAVPGGVSLGELRAGTPFLIVLALGIVGALIRGAFAVAGHRGIGPLATATGSPAPPPTPDWREPGWAFGLPFTWALICLTIVPLAVYVATYIPWALTTAGSPQIIAGWPPGHTGETLLDVTANMYRYHNELRLPHASSSPWWAWPFDFKPIWGYNESFSGGRQATIFMTGNVVLFWFGIPAMAFGLWQAWRRRSAGLTFIAVALLSLWLSWSRIDRVAYQYHWYTSLPFFLVLLAYFLAELWHGPSPRTWRFARLAAAIVVMAPGVMWLGKGALCMAAGVPDASAVEVCGPSEPVVSIASTVYLLLAGALAWWVILPAREPRRLVIAVGIAATAFFVAFLPVLTGMALPEGWSVAYQQLLPTWNLDFRFGSNTNAAPRISVLSLGPVVLGLIAALTAVWAYRSRRRDGRDPAETTGLNELPVVGPGLPTA